jgi:hypothetical protein
MKCHILIPCLMLTFLANSYSQVPIGIKAGLNLNDIVIKNAPFLPIRTYTPSLGFHIGVTTTFNLSNKLTFNPDLLFIQKGANTSFGDDQILGSLSVVNTVDGRVNLNYLELPLLLSFTPTKLISFDLGPNLGLRISAKGKTDSSKSDIRDVFNKPFDFGVSGGLKLNLTKKISIISRYYYGLISPMKFQATSSTPSPSGSNRSLLLGMSYLLK